jgi:hypothetical protein
VAPDRLESPVGYGLSSWNVLNGEGVAAVEWLDGLLPAAGGDVPERASSLARVT